jgi:hypothetical protein
VAAEMHKVFCWGKLEVKRPIGKPGSGWKDNIKNIFTE